MDEDPSEDMNHMNGEKISKEYSWEPLPTQMKAISMAKLLSDFTSQPPPTERQERLHNGPPQMKVKSLAELLSDCPSWPPPTEQEERLHNGSLIRRRMEIEMMRNLQKLEKVCKHRGLPLDKEALCSDASKDAFDLRDLNESLPSTSENKLSNGVYRRIVHMGSSYPLLLWRQNVERGMRLDSASLPEFNRTPGEFNLLKDRDIRNKKSVETKLRELAIVKRKFHELLKKRRDEQNSPSEDRKISITEKALQSLEGQGVHFNWNAAIPFGDKPDEKSSHVESNLQNVGFPPLPQPIRDSERTWITDFQSPQLSVPLNSPTKFVMSDPEFDGTGINRAAAKLLAETQAHRFKEFRSENKLQLQNSNRGVVSGDMDDTSSEPVKIPYHFSGRSVTDSQNSLLTVDSITVNRLEFFRGLSQTNSESRKSIGSDFSLGNLDSDDVLSD